LRIIGKPKMGNSKSHTIRDVIDVINHDVSRAITGGGSHVYYKNNLTDDTSSHIDEDITVAYYKKYLVVGNNVIGTMKVIYAMFDSHKYIKQFSDINMDIIQFILKYIVNKRLHEVSLRRYKMLSYPKRYSGLKSLINDIIAEPVCELYNVVKYIYNDVSKDLYKDDVGINMLGYSMPIDIDRVAEMKVSHIVDIICVFHPDIDHIDNSHVNFSCTHYINQFPDVDRDSIRHILKRCVETRINIITNGRFKKTDNVADFGEIDEILSIQLREK
jgi:hypothetical protein